MSKPLPQNNALIIIDIQNDYFTGGLWSVDQMDHMAAKAAEILATRSRLSLMHAAPKYSHLAA
ncbi:hypothetical protein GV827_12020 [Sulfitobacter sp. JBTF-M27]|uniref:Isochorismatase family protein n=1 Tax=Sulfitobacter sediminilitoris TaxID=2698830 RepID=A0A6P0CD68_9RHOB|nr:hypothetical protein [Sulfitobacter sediminilitoris]